ncbi:beta-mannosidase [Tumebacillus permanentifrigoris]|uniref:Beta-mannosidase B n=1 Tax=Tumebacillus permanentifrigoris TaxID=378543 RepID=A0A316DFM7_9BACL|nr:glycoside hydrolase family 2 protein [Tumebacillus permanentifrigoris]PWK16408.1 beta-mannosidase [Tumebacillus permanentifrigoris]
MKIDRNWKIQSFDVGQVRDLYVAAPEYVDHFWLPAAVPGDVHSTLIEKRIIDDPFVGHNDLKCQWVEAKVWWYRTEFSFDASGWAGEALELTFEGLDTFATVYLNGVELGSTANMFIAHTFDVTREVRDGRNIIAVKFDPIDPHVRDKQHTQWSGYSAERIWTRKCQSNFGWDWGPRIVTAGIWKDVYLTTRHAAKIESVFAKTTSLQAGLAILDVEVAVESFAEMQHAVLEVRLQAADGIVHTSARPLHPYRETTNRVDRPYLGSASLHRMTLEIPDPHLWWTHDLGDPHLYRLDVIVSGEQGVVDRVAQQVGIRTIEVEQVDQDGQSVFAFVLNGIKLFAKGANWIPIDNMIGAVPDTRYVHLIELAKRGNMNMLRIWGGGIYEKDVFYDECDRQGILIWQDFMFACALYPDFNRNFMENVREEIVQVVKRLRNRACLALWCGNNEIDWVYEVFTANGEVTTPFYGQKIFHDLMPKLLRDLDPTRFYWPSSPYGGNDHNAAEAGDRHNWQVWHGNIEPRRFGEIQQQDYSIEGVSFKNFKKDLSRFVSEFGMHAAADRYTLQQNIPDGQFYWGSAEMSYRNKDYHHQKGILLMEGYTGIPQDIEQYLFFSMLTQAEGLKYGIEHYRRNKPLTSGTLFWQLNDCWPGTSWSVIDYYLIPKASYYYARRFYEPLLLTIEHDPEQPLHIWVVNDRLVEYVDDVCVEAIRFDGTLLSSNTMPVRVPSNTAQQISTLTEAEILRGCPPEEVGVRVRSLSGQARPNTYFLRDQKHLRLPQTPGLQVQVDREARTVTVMSQKFARFVRLELPAKSVVYSDNYFDVLPGESVQIQVERLDGGEIPWDHLHISSVNAVSGDGEGGR